MWRYTPLTVSPRIKHVDGSVPARPLEVGDYVIEPSGIIRYVVAVSESMLLLDSSNGRRHWAYRAPTEGDMSGVIVEIPRRGR